MNYVQYILNVLVMSLPTSKCTLCKLAYTGYPTTYLILLVHKFENCIVHNV